MPLTKSRDLLNMCVQADLPTFMRMAFAVGTLQMAASEESFKTFATDLNGRTELSITMMSLLRRLHFEAVTMVVMHLKTNVATDAGVEGSEKLPPVERVERLQGQQVRLKGLTIKGETQPSYALINVVTGICDSGSIVWVPPSKCTNRDSEVKQSLKEKPTTLTVDRQPLKLAVGEPKIGADTSNELLMQRDLQRRGLAFDPCKLISNDIHDKWAQVLLMQLTREAPSGYARVTMEQILRADKELFPLMSQDHAGPFNAGPKGELFLVLLMTQLMHCPSINVHWSPFSQCFSQSCIKFTC